MEGTIDRHGITNSLVEINIYRNLEGEINKVTLFIPNNRSIDISLKEAKALKEIIMSCRDI